MRAQGKNLYAMGISHITSSPDIIGACGMRGGECRKLEEVFIALGCSEALILSTCNRVELYVVGENIPLEKILEAMPKAWRDAGFGLNVAKNCDAVEHLFEVASGLQSQMTGETEILGQVKAAYAAACDAGHCGSVLNPVFQKAAQCAKWIRTNTDIGRGKISIGSVSSELACRIFDDISLTRILLIGSGEAGRLVAEALRVRGAESIVISSRTLANAESLAADIKSSAMPLDSAIADLSRFDIVISASFADRPFISRRDVEKAMEERRGRPMFLVDLGVPRNMEADCAEVGDAYLYNLADLSRIANENLENRRGEMESAKKETARRAGDLARRLFETA